MRWKEEKSWPLEEEEKNNYSLLPFAGLPRRIHARAKRDACMFWELSTCSRCWYQQTFKQMAGSSLKHAPSRSRETSLPFFAHLYLQLRRRRKSFSKQQQKTIQKQRLLCLLAPAQPAQPERGDVDGAARARHQDGRGKERLSWEEEREEKEEKKRNSSRPRTEALDDDLKKKCVIRFSLFLNPVLLLLLPSPPLQPHSQVEQSTRSTNRSFKKLISANGASPELIYQTLCEQEVSLVFTAHPTQALRQSLLKKYGAIRRDMDRLHNARMSPYERLECLEDIKAQVQGAWRTDEIRRQKPTPQAEMRQGLSYFHATIAPSLPLFYRRIDTALAQIGQPRLPLDRSLFRFGSWMGGDRDGNPFVTADTTRDVVIAVRFFGFFSPLFSAFSFLFISFLVLV
jgi:hypothetical protein